MKKPDLSWLGGIAEKILPVLIKYRALLVVLLAGVLLLASAGWPGSGRRDPVQETAPAAADEEGFSLSAFEENLNQKLAAIEGVGRVGLMLSLDQTEEAVYAVNTRRTDSEIVGQKGKEVRHGARVPEYDKANDQGDGGSYGILHVLSPPAGGSPGGSPACRGGPWSRCCR